MLCFPMAMRTSKLYVMLRTTVKISTYTMTGTSRITANCVRFSVLLRFCPNL
jgi:hypothetical protein